MDKDEDVKYVHNINKKPDSEKMMSQPIPSFRNPAFACSVPQPPKVCKDSRVDLPYLKLMSGIGEGEDSSKIPVFESLSNLKKDNYEESLHLTLQDDEEEDEGETIFTIRLVSVGSSSIPLRSGTGSSSWAARSSSGELSARVSTVPSLLYVPPGSFPQAGRAKTTSSNSRLRVRMRILRSAWPCEPRNRYLNLMASMRIAVS